ncbi:MAG: [NiFe] hydrogenase metallocenter assembly protein HypF [Myxococcales bacterium]|nr:[NiFe] hydrogenase metallocenter assembly protein HypF [Myxococcales bacterium]
MEARDLEDRYRRTIRIRGVVQGVGFRPAMYRLAGSLGLAGFVLNDPEGVWLEIEGSSNAIALFVEGIAVVAPPASRIDAIEERSVSPLGEQGFRIAASEMTEGTTYVTAEIPADLAPCDDCLRELANLFDRRAGYPFINCTACGPRFTIVRSVPYDRPKTTMADFVMCAACQREYDDPADRRFHAEPNACPACGPRVRLICGDSEVVSGASAITRAAQAIADGAIVAVKGAGGYALAIDATREDTVQRLRERKHRPRKPFAVMGRSLSELARVGDIERAQELLTSPIRPIVLVPGRMRSPLATGVAPGLADVGVYLPPTPLQYLLLAEGPPLQVMTSGNLAEEPIARTDEEARTRLAGVADMFLIHDREIHARADDSVLRVTARGPIPIRRARGLVPEGIRLPIEGPPLVAVGGHERNTVCVCRGGRAVLSPHIGDLDHPDAEAFFRESIQRMCELVGVVPVAVAHDLHPDYASTRWAIASGLPAVSVQHHHAHVAACLAEHGRTDRAIGIAFDGTGLGEDGTLWGGEILEADLATSRRLGHLRAIALPGGEAAIRQPWRLALAAAIDAGIGIERVNGVDRTCWRRVQALIAADIVAARATGAGRWFDAVAALIGVGHIASHDGQLAAELEAIATPVSRARSLPFEVELVDHGVKPFEIDLRPTIRHIAHEQRRGTTRAELAARFHATLAWAIRQACHRARTAGAPSTVVLTGGCFQNRRLLEHTSELLEADGFEVLVHRRVPPNDGGLALGQAAIASCQLARGGSHVSSGTR